MKWLKSIWELVKDICTFIRLRNSQVSKYQGILGDFEVLNNLNNQIKERMGIIYKKIDLFPGLEDVLKNYTDYIKDMEYRYSKMRVDVLNNLFVEKEKNVVVTDPRDRVRVRRAGPREFPHRRFQQQEFNMQGGASDGQPK